LPTPEQIEVAESLGRLAEIDLATAEKLAPDPEMDDRPVGFHAQQAVEKALKVALMLEGIDFPKTHDLEYLIVLAEKLHRHGARARVGVLADPLGRRIPI
jgi:HEPN domain-containing protein